MIRTLEELKLPLHVTSLEKQHSKKKRAFLFHYLFVYSRAVWRVFLDPNAIQFAKTFPSQVLWY